MAALKVVLLLMPLVALIGQTPCLARSLSQNGVGREEKQADFSLFTVVNFQNSPCVTTSNGRNGTCYPLNVCADKGGVSSGACAEGFGVCCLVLLSCGAVTTANNTHLVNPTSPDGVSCTYQICKSSPSVCRIFFDFTTFQLAPPVVATVDGTVTTTGGAVGDCVTDQFSISGPPGTPVICGNNDGQHMIVDAIDSCNTVNIRTSASTSQRRWDIFVKQYGCEEFDVAGPMGCLQYFTAGTGNIRSFNFPATGGVGATVTHLSNQHYNICIRRAANMCSICYGTTILPAIAVATDQHSFGLSGSAAVSAVDTDCSSDYITIPGGQQRKNAKLVTANTNVGSNTRFCGRFFRTTSGTSPRTVCTSNVPFIVGVNFDADEDGMETTAVPGGIIGFSIKYQQDECI